MIGLKITEAYDFYSTYIHRKDLLDLLTHHNLKTAGSVPSIMWELFGSILTGRSGTSGYGADLEGLEVKSAKEGGSFEYQYHLNTGLEKLKEDQHVDHLFCAYSSDYKSLKVYYIEGANLADTFKKWIPEYTDNYSQKRGKTRRQRFRKAISYGRVVKEGKVVMSVKDALLEPNEKDPACM